MPFVPSQWSVFERDGRRLCTVKPPANSRPMEIGPDHVLAVARDSDGVETVGLHDRLGGCGILHR